MNRAWWREAARTAFFLPPRWAGLRGSATTAVLSTVAAIGMLASITCAYVDGPARLYVPALFQAALPPLVTAWLCAWLLAEDGFTAAPQAATRASTAYTLLMLQSIVLMVLMAPALVALTRAGRWQVWNQNGWSLLPWLWFTLAAAVLLWRASRRQRQHRWQRTAGVGVLVASAWACSVWQPPIMWYSATPHDAEPPFALDPAAIEQQMAVLPGQLQTIAEQRPGVVDMYALTFAPDAAEDVFLRESRMVAEVMQQRFGAAGKTLQLANHRSTVTELAWATPDNLQRAIHGVAQRMDLNEDILFIHLTSHGARDGKLAAEFEPLNMPELTPALLQAALDAAGVRHRIVSVSACYSGSWIAPLQGEHSLVLTAADAQHTSYGCGRKSELTFFGRALYDEALRRDTLDFEVAHAQARRVIEQREKEASKDDGYSNPQIRMGAAMRDKLRGLQK